MTLWSAAAKRSGDAALDETNPAANASGTDRKASGQIGEVGPLRCNGPARVQRAESVDGQRTPETGLRRLMLRSATRTLRRRVPTSGTSDAAMFRPYRPAVNGGTFPGAALRFTPGFHIAGLQPGESHLNALPFSDWAVEYSPLVTILPRLVA